MQVNDKAVLCVGCGAKLESSAPATDMNSKVFLYNAKKKNEWRGAFLNALLPGLGYIYAKDIMTLFLTYAFVLPLGIIVLLRTILLGALENIFWANLCSYLIFILLVTIDVFSNIKKDNKKLAEQLGVPIE